LLVVIAEGRRKKEEGRGKKEVRTAKTRRTRRKREEGRGKREK